MPYMEVVKTGKVINLKQYQYVWRVLFYERTKDIVRTDQVLLQKEKDHLLCARVSFDRPADDAHAYRELHDEKSGRVHDRQNMQRAGYHCDGIFQLGRIF